MLGILTIKRSWDTNKHLEIIDIFVTLIMMIVSRVYTYTHAHQITSASFLLLTVQWHSKTNGFCFSLLVSQWVSQWYRVKLKNHNNSISENFKQFILCSLLRRNSAYYVWALRNPRKVRNWPRTAFLSINSRLHAKKNWKKHLKI